MFDKTRVMTAAKRFMDGASSVDSFYKEITQILAEESGHSGSKKGAGPSDGSGAAANRGEGGLAADPERLRVCLRENVGIAAAVMGSSCTSLGVGLAIGKGPLDRYMADGLRKLSGAGIDLEGKALPQTTIDGERVRIEATSCCIAAEFT